MVVQARGTDRHLFVFRPPGVSRGDVGELCGENRPDGGGPVSRVFGQPSTDFCLSFSERKNERVTHPINLSRPLAVKIFR